MHGLYACTCITALVQNSQCQTLSMTECAFVLTRYASPETHALYGLDLSTFSLKQALNPHQIRCTSCNIVKTPEWRKGPLGKSPSHLSYPFPNLFRRASLIQRLTPRSRAFLSLLLYLFIFFRPVISARDTLNHNARTSNALQRMCFE